MSAAEKSTLLIVDDERVNRSLLAELFHYDCRVLLAKDGPTALRCAQEEPVSLILLDASMPGMDGYEVLRLLKEDERTQNISVIFVTGHTDIEDEERGLLLGAVDYITKPIRPLLVQARVHNHLKLVQQRAELERLSLQDPLTGLLNRRGFDQAFTRACNHTIRSGETLSVAMIDVDYFKQYNDCYGHGSGDETLKHVAQVLTKAMRRPHDQVARYGGEEFALLMPGATNLEYVLENIRAQVEALNIPHEHSTVAACVTVSCGGVLGNASAARSPDKLLALADAALYQAKGNGRNCTVAHTSTLVL